MGVSLYSANELANVADFLTRANFDRVGLHEVAEHLAIWSVGNARAFNEQYYKRLRPLYTSEIVGAYDSPTFRYDRARALTSLRQMSYNVETGDGKSPENFESFDEKRYFRAFAWIMDLAFTRIYDSGIE
jgi:hypothetical protein